MSSSNYENPWEDQIGETRSEPEWTHLRKLISKRKIIRELQTGRVYCIQSKRYVSCAKQNETNTVDA
jgi:hypothetical protein